VDGRHFDALAKHASTRRTALGGVVAGLLLPLDGAPRSKEKKRERKGKNHASAQIET
jgi:hypothetical protein